MSNLTCITCHNTHGNEDGKIEVFSKKCLSCHNDEHGKICKMTSSVGPTIIKNCIDCHMPKQASHAVSVYLQGNDVPTSAMMRTHFIKVYPEISKQSVESFKKFYRKNVH